MENSSKRTPFIIGFNGTTLNPKLQDHLRKMNPSGLILFKRNIESIQQTRQLIRQLVDLLGDIIIAVDHEGGIVNRFPSDCPVPPSPAALKAVGSWDLVREACTMQAQLLSFLGFNMNFVPLVDLALFSENRVIGTRAYSDQPNEVAEFSRICIEEHTKLNIGTTAKHFPTHGRTITDTHYAVGSVTHENQGQLEQDLLPYEKAIEFDVPAIMTAHLSYPVLDKRLPASLSKPILTGLLKEQLGFRGLIISDCVEMDGLSRSYDSETIIKTGLQAGIDLFISSFSLKRSPEYQLSLKKAFDAFDRELPSLNQGITQKTEQFLKCFPPLPDSTDSIPLLEKAILLHRKTLEKRSASDMAEPFRKFYLVELSNGNSKGINADNQWSAAADEIVADCKLIVDKKLIYQCNNSQLNSIVDICNRSGLTLLMLTANGNRIRGYNKFIQNLNRAESAVHVALLDPDDLRDICGNEWATLGYNACTGKMLALELDC